MFSDKLKQYRKEHNISQEKLSRLSGVLIVDISLIERGKMYAGMNIIRKIAKATNTDIDYWLDGDTNVREKSSYNMVHKEVIHRRKREEGQKITNKLDNIIEINHHFADRIIEYCDEHKMSLNKLSVITDIARSTLFYLRSNKRTSIRCSILAKLVKGTHTDIEYWLGEVDNIEDIKRAVKVINSKKSSRYIGDKIKAYREKNNMSLKDFSLLTGLTQKNIKMLEANYREVNLSSLTKIVYATNTDEDYWLEDK